MRTFLVLLPLLAAVSCNRTSQEPRQSLAGPLISYANTVDQVAPAVVTIRSSKRVRAPQQFPFFEDQFFRQFFRGGVPRGGGQTEVEHALGSGVIVQADGHILTNHHVVDGA